MPFPFRYVKEKQAGMPDSVLGKPVEIADDYRLRSGSVVEAGRKGRIYMGNLPGGSILGDQIPVVLEGTDAFVGIDRGKLRYL